MKPRVNVYGLCYVVHVLLLVVLATALPASAGITTVGDLDPVYGGADPWTITGDFILGNTADANMVVTSGSSVSDPNAWMAYGAGTVADVSISGSGSEWTHTYALVVGYEGQGILDVNDGGAVSSYATIVAYQPDSIGSVELTGAGTTWTTSDDVLLGLRGQGEVEILDGAEMTTEDMYIGYEPNGVGDLNINGAGSSLEVEDILYAGYTGDANVVVENAGQLNAGDTLYVGYGGDANMVIQTGGVVSDGYGIIGSNEGSDGHVTVTGPNSVWINGRGLGVGTLGNGSLLVQDGATVTSLESGIGIGPNSVATVEVTGTDSTWTNAEELGIGLSGTGQLTISNGGAVTNTHAFIGGFDPEAPNIDIAWLGDVVSGGTGVVEVTGTGSQWTSDGFLYVGYVGTGTLDVNDGGVVTSVYGAVGADANSTGTVMVSDSGSQWNVSQDLAIGGYGQGELAIESGGAVDANTLYIGGFDTDILGGDVNDVPQGTGTVTVTGTDSTLDVDDFLFVGYTGTGTLDVNDGGVVTSVYGGVGADANSTGTATVSGTGSEWNVSQGLAVGAYGEGQLTIESAGAVDADTLYVGGFDTDILGGDVNDVPQGTGTVTVTGTGSTLDVDDFIFVGYTGTGTLDVNDGGVVTSVYGGVGADANSTGAATVSGAGSQWNVSQGLAVGAYGQGMLTIESAGAVDANTLYVGGFDTDVLGGDANDVPQGEGMLRVTGTDSELDVTDGLYVGYTGTGTLDVNDGGTVDSGAGYIAYLADSSGSATVSGMGSSWTPDSLAVGYVGGGSLEVSSGGLVDTDEFIVGDYETGSLLISTGGTVDANTVWIGQAQNSQGSGTIVGSGTTLDANDMYVGGWGQGSLTVADGAQIISQWTGIGTFWSATGSATVTGADTRWTVLDDLHVGYDGAGSLTIRDGAQVTSDEGFIAEDSSDSTGTVTVTGSGSLLDIDSGLYVGGNATTAGGTAVLDVNDGGAVIANETIIWDDGTLSGDGTLTSPTVTNYGTIAPGNSIGTFTIDGDLTMDANSVLEVEVDNDDNSDRLTVTGDATIEGGTVQVSSEETIRGTHEYTILDANSVTGTFDTLDTALVQGNVTTSDLDYDTTVVTLELTAIGFDIGQTRNQRSLGVGLQEIAVGGGNAVTTLLQAVPTQEELLDHYDQLGGQSRPSLAPIAVAGTGRFMGTVSRRFMHSRSTAGLGGYGTPGVTAAGGDGPVGDDTPYQTRMSASDFVVGNGSAVLGDRPWGVWGKGYGLFGSRDDDVEAPGYDYTIYGAGFGLDFQVSDAVLVGATVGYADGDVDYDRLADTTDLSSVQAGLYGSWNDNGRYFDSLLMYSDLEYETQRRVELTGEELEGDFGGYALSGYFETGFDWRRLRGWLLQPLASFQLSYLDLDGYRESGGDAALGYDDQSYESYKGSLGVRVTKDLWADTPGKSLVMQLRARWLHEFGDTYSSVDTYFASDPTTVFAIRDECMDRDSAMLGVGVGARLNDRTRLYADYDARLNADDTAHIVSAGLRYCW